MSSFLGADHVTVKSQWGFAGLGGTGPDREPINQPFWGN